MGKTDIHLDIVWGEKSDHILSEICLFWENLGVIPPGVSARERAKQVVILARSESGEIIGVTTAYPIYVDRLQNHLMAYRGLVHPEFRIPGLFILMTRKSIAHLESIHQQLDPVPIGIMAEIENNGLQKNRKTVTPSGLTLIGFSKKGNPLMVRYFKGSRY